MKEYKYKINGVKFTVNVGDVIDNEVVVEVNGTPYKVELEKAAKSGPVKPALTQSGKTESVKMATAPEKPVKAAPLPSGGAASVKSPLPGTIMSFKVKVGDTVKSGDTVCVLEAMKMENDIHTTKGGVIKQILVNVGDAVAEGADLMIIE